MEKIQVNTNNLNLDTDVLCLDFANTAEWHASPQPIEYLNNYADLVSWAVDRGLVSGEEVAALIQIGTERPAEAETVLVWAIDLREAIYRIFSAIANDEPPSDADIAHLNQALQDSLRHLKIVQEGEGFSWVWQGERASLDWMLWPIVYSTAEMLTSDQLKRVKECEDDRGCGYLFLDLSKNRSRRWCAMRSCGNRAKVRRHRQRQQSAN